MRCYFFLVLFTCVETETKRSYFFSKVVHTVGRWPRLVYRPLILDRHFSSALWLPGAWVQFAWYLGSEKDTYSLLYAQLTFHSVSLPSLITPRCSVHFGRIGFQPAPHLQDTHFYLPHLSSCILLLRVLVCSYSCTGSLAELYCSYRDSSGRKTVEFQKCELLLLILKTENIFLYTFRNTSIWVVS